MLGAQTIALPDFFLSDRAIEILRYLDSRFTAEFGLLIELVA